MLMIVECKTGLVFVPESIEATRRGKLATKS